jgi:hypothetical protein
MRTEQQIKRKLNELSMQKRSLESRLADDTTIQPQIDQLAASILLLEWVLNEPAGSYHA